LVRRLAGEVRVPAKSTIHARHGLVKRIGRTRRRASGTPLSPGAAPNDLWCADFKGEFKLGNGRYCDPLTVTDHASRFPPLCEALDSTCEDLAVTAFERTRPAAGHPLRQRRALCQPQRLVQPAKALSLVAPARHRHRAHEARPSATKWRHERTHLTLKNEATRPPGMNILQQQARFDAFVHEFNAERPHEALAMKCPAEIYSASTRPYPDIAYPFHDRDILVTACGRICMHSKKISISTVLAGQRLGINEVDDGTWLVSFMHYDLGYFDLEQRTLQALDNPFGPRLLPMLRYVPLPMS
jgi:transposase InsO family protein